jgi:ribosomal-protein-alanine N-acetyltransferase
MSATERLTKTSVLPFGIRPMEERDIARVSEIERDAFPTLMAPTSFRRELTNRLASYRVAWRRDDPFGNGASAAHAPNAAGQVNVRRLISGLLCNARGLWPMRSSASEPGQDFLAGFIGTWYREDEVHIVSVGVRREYRGWGIEELLLIAAIEDAIGRRASVVTLEVRVSNHVARRLYQKYGFKERDKRKGYYTDNREDALIMTTDPIQLPPYQEQLWKLMRAHERRWSYAPAEPYPSLPATPGSAAQGT